MYIKKVTGTIKGGVDAVLTEKTLIIGSNGAGKSAIVNAVELALVGGASDIEGRAWVQDVKRIKRLGSTVNAVATLSDDSTCSYRVEKSKAQHQNGVGGSLPYREVRDALTGSPAKAYKYLLSQCAAGLTLDEVLKRIPFDLQELYMTAISGSSAVEELLEAQEVAAKQARDSAKEAKGAQEAANLAAQGIGPMVLDAELREAKILLDQAVAYENDALNRQRYEEQYKKLADLEAYETLLKSQIAESGGELPPNAQERVTTLIRVIGYHLEKSVPSCGVCGGSFDAVAAQQSLEQLQAWKTKIQQSKTASYKAELGQVTKQIEITRQVLTQSQIRPSVSQPAMSVQEADTQYMDLIGRIGANDQHQLLQGHIITFQKQAEKWKALSTLLNTLVKDFVDAGMAKLMARVQGFLADTDVFGMKLTKSDCQIGFIREGALTTALSGAEWARLLVAIACACASEGVPVVIPEERMWDRETLAKTMRALKDAPCQIILTSTEKPKGKLPAGWSVVEVS